MESWEDLAAWRSQVNEEELFLTRIITKIDEQINCLQVEQMEILSQMRDNAQSPIDKKPETDEPKDKTAEQLDLSIPVNKKTDIEEEEEEEEDNDDEDDDDNNDNDNKDV